MGGVRSVVGAFGDVTAEARGKECVNRRDESWVGFVCFVSLEWRIRLGRVSSLALEHRRRPKRVRIIRRGAAQHGAARRALRACRAVHAIYAAHVDAEELFVV
eukprot:2308367-Pleurochrysis_carterae.AAC.6